MADLSSYIYIWMLIVLPLDLVTLASSNDVTSESTTCPRHCQCFTVSYSSPLQSWQIKQYMDKYQWEEGAKAVGCLGRAKIPQNITPDVKYLLLLGNGKAKRRNRIENSKHLYETIQSIWNSPGEVQTERIWRQIKSMTEDAFYNTRNLVHLDLSGNKIQDLHCGSFIQMRDLENLSLKQNRLKTLPETVFGDLSKLTMLDLSGNNLRYLPELFRNNTHLISLDLSNNLLIYMPARSLHWLIHLQSVNISNNRLLDIPSRLLIDLVDIQEIYLDNNKLRVIAYDMFRTNTKLEVLSLTNNRIRTLEGYAFYYQNNLRQLDLSGNKLIKIPKTVFWGTQAMLWLDLSRNNISKIANGAFAKIQNLTELVLSDNKLNAVTAATLDELPKLRKLNLARNNITIIDAGSMQGMKALRVLDLSFNNLETIAAHTFYGLEDLTDLHLANNKIKKLSPEAFKVSVFSFTSGLTWLNLQANGLTHLEPHAFYGAPNVKVLNLGNNNINSIAENSFNGLTGLRNLILGGNKLQMIQKSQFQLLSRLESLDLSTNEIESLAVGAMKGLEKLLELNLEDNYLKIKNFSWTNRLTSLEELNINKNGLTELPNQILINLRNLRVLSVALNGISQIDVPLESRVRLTKLVLAANKLRSIEPSIQRILQVGSVIDVSSNPWHCDCAMTSTINELLSSWRVKFENVAETSCASPQAFQHRSLHTLTTIEDTLCASQNAPLNRESEKTNAEAVTTPSPCHTTRRLSKDPGVWPWHAVLWNAITQTAMCNGALIGSNWVLSTLRCLEPHTSFGHDSPSNDAYGHITGTIPVPRHWVVKLGKSHNLKNSEPNEQIYSIIQVHIPAGNKKTADWDRPILIELSSLAAVSQYILPICSADARVDVKDTIVTGWQRMSRSSQIKLFSVNYTSAPVCVEKNKLRDFICIKKTNNTNEQYAIYNNLGAPLVTHVSDSWFLVGILTDVTTEETQLLDVRPFSQWLHQKML